MITSESISSKWPVKGKTFLMILHSKNVSAVSAKIMESFIKGEFDRVDIIYNHFKNAASSDTDK